MNQSDYYPFCVETPTLYNSFQVGIIGYEFVNAFTLPVEISFLCSKYVPILMEPVRHTDSKYFPTALEYFGKNQNDRQIYQMRGLNSLAGDLNLEQRNIGSSNWWKIYKDSLIGEMEKSDSGEENSRNENVHELMKYYPNYIQTVPSSKGTKRVKKTIFWKYPGCSKYFTKAWNFVDHARMHLGERPFKWDLWNLRFTQKGNKRQHMKRHLDV